MNVVVFVIYLLFLYTYIQATWHNNEQSHLTILSPYKADVTKI